jgi:PAS domain S-box-containing protein
MDRFMQSRHGNNLRKVVEVTGLRKDGSEFPMELTLGVWKGHGDTFVTGIIRDVTKHREKERALRESEERFRTFLENSRDMVSIWERSGRRVLWANTAWTRALGYSPEELENVDEKVHHDDHEKVLAAWKRLQREGGDLRFPQYRFRKANGEYAVLDTTVSCLEAGGKDLWYFVSRDISELVSLRREKHLRMNMGGIVGRDPKITDIFESISELAQVDAPVLILGESGTGKELVARAIHDEGPRSEKNFVAVNCSALSEGLLEGELFGHVRGAFTGAHRDKKGRFELADGGTIFLDEIGDISPPLQVKLLRVLQEGTFERVGSEKPTRVDVRLISATNRDLKADVARGRFRQDLYYRVNVVPLTLPPLRERPGDIFLIADHILQEEAGKYDRRNDPDRGRGQVKLDPSVISILLGHPWPGNVRELQNIIRFSLIKCRGGVILPEHLPPALTLPSRPSLSTAKRRGKLTAAAVREALDMSGGNRARAAKTLGVSRATLYRFLGNETAGED